VLISQSALRGYRERDREMKDALFRESTPPPPSTTVPFQDRGDRDLTDDMRLPERAGSVANADRAHLATSNGVPTGPPVGQLHEEEEEEDYEAMIAAAEAEAEEAQRELASTTSAKMQVSGGAAETGDQAGDDDEFPPISIDEQEVAMMGSAPATAKPNAASVAHGGKDEYEDDWAAMDGM
jgi:hypothetical protein